MRLLLLFAVATTSVLSAAETVTPATGRPGGVEIIADDQESEGPISRAMGNVEIRDGGVRLTADRVEYDDETGEVTASGKVHYWNENGFEDLFASKVSYNTRTETGTFYDVTGRVSAASQAGARILTTDNPFYIDGPVVTKTGDTYVVHDGEVTNCDPQSMWWRFRSPKTEIVPGESATIHRGVFRLKGVPLLYVPVYKKSLERVPRRSGFLTPSVGTSSRFGFVLGQSYYWAINRSYDATINGTLYSSRGFANQTSVRGRPTKNSTFDALFFGVQDRGPQLQDGTRGDSQSGSEVKLRGTTKIPGGFRGVADIRYLSSLGFRQAFTQTYEEAVFSQVRSIGFITKSFSTYSINAALNREENFQSSEPGDTIVIRKLPSLEFNSRDRMLLEGPTPVYFSFDSAFDLVSRTQETYQTRRYVQRGDLFPRVSTDLNWKGFNVTPTLGGRITGYGQQRGPEGLIGENLYRSSADFSVDIAPPALQRVFKAPSWLGDKMKHVIEPRLRYRYTKGVNEFGSIVRFDERDILNNTNEADISLTQRLYVKHNATGMTREVASLEVWQRRFFDPTLGNAIVADGRNVFRSSLDVTPFAFFNEQRNYSPVGTALRLNPTYRLGVEWRADYDPLRDKFVNSTISGNYQLTSKLFVGAGHSAIRAPETLAPPTNQVTTIARYGDFNRRGWNVAMSTIYDYQRHSFIYWASQASYNTNCCGFGAEVRRVGFGEPRNEFRISLSIANVGSFGTLRPQERLF